MFRSHLNLSICGLLVKAGWKYRSYKQVLSVCIKLIHWSSLQCWPCIQCQIELHSSIVRITLILFRFVYIGNPVYKAPAIAGSGRVRCTQPNYQKWMGCFCSLNLWPSGCNRKISLLHQGSPLYFSFSHFFSLNHGCSPPPLPFSLSLYVISAVFSPLRLLTFYLKNFNNYFVQACVTKLIFFQVLALSHALITKRTKKTKRRKAFIIVKHGVRLLFVLSNFVGDFCKRTYDVYNPYLSWGTIWCLLDPSFPPPTPKTPSFLLKIYVKTNMTINLIRL